MLIARSLPPRMFLTDIELEELTGYRSSSAQIGWLRKHGWKFVLNRLGQPRVARAYCEAELGVRAEQPDEPNWEALSGSTSKGRHR